VWQRPESNRLERLFRSWSCVSAGLPSLRPSAKMKVSFYCPLSGVLG